MQNIITKYKKYSLISILLFSVACYAFVFYVVKSRENTLSLFIVYGLLFACYLIALNYLKKYSNTKNHFLLYFSIGLRLVPLLSMPILSDDFYRFIWDGQVLHNRINPFAYTPFQIINDQLQNGNTIIFNNLNSPNYYSVYPPVNQFIFWLSGFAPKNSILLSVIILRLCLLAFDIGNLILIKKLLIYKKLKPNLIYIYALNPLIIIEFVGNLHFEVAMLFFMLLSIYLFLKEKSNWSAVCLGLAVCTKLLPVIFVPLLLKEIGWLKTITYGFLVASTSLLLFLPFLHNEHLQANFVSSIKLYYGFFEFNGSFYQLFKYWGWVYFGYNPMKYISKILIMLTILGFVLTYIKSKNIFEGLFFLFFIYCVFGAIVHPWYILPLIAFSPFIPWRFGVLWSGIIFVSYYTYKSYPYNESIFLVAIEYTLLFSFVIYEVYKHRRVNI